MKKLRKNKIKYEPIVEELDIKEPRGKYRVFIYFVVYVFILCFILFFLIKSIKSKADIQASFNSYKYNNGTHLFTPTVILISLDGFRAEYLNRGITKNLNKIGMIIANMKLSRELVQI